MAMKPIKFSLIIFILFTLFSCTSQKNFLYLQDKGNSSLKTQADTFDYRIRSKDLLFIKILSIDQASSTSLNPASQTSDISGTQSAYLNGYYVSDSGFVELPLIGKILVQGLTIEESQKAVQKKVNIYLKNSLAVVKLLNFNITVLGEVNNPGNFSIYNTRLNLLEAIGYAGDLTINANRKQIMLIRQENTEKIISIDLTDKNVLQSEYFYMLPNDVIYVKPNKSKFYGTNPFPFAAVLSTVTTLILVLNFISK
jgi:polysaccharide biosynthesis/export protein